MRQSCCDCAFTDYDSPAHSRRRTFCDFSSRVKICQHQESRLEWPSTTLNSVSQTKSACGCRTRLHGCSDITVMMTSEALPSLDSLLPIRPFLGPPTFPKRYFSSCYPMQHQMCLKAFSIHHASLFSYRSILYKI